MLPPPFLPSPWQLGVAAGDKNAGKAGSHDQVGWSHDSARVSAAVIIIKP